MQGTGMSICFHWKIDITLTICLCQKIKNIFEKLVVGRQQFYEPKAISKLTNTTCYPHLMMT